MSISLHIGSETSRRETMWNCPVSRSLAFVHNNVFGRFLNKNLLGDSLGHIAAGASVEHRFENCWLINTSHVAIFVCHQGTVNSAIDFRP